VKINENHLTGSKGSFSTSFLASGQGLQNQNTTWTICNDPNYQTPLISGGYLLCASTGGSPPVS
jgi:hypothetical protein